MHWREIIRRPIITEKSSSLGVHNQYCFEVAAESNKSQIADAVERAWPDVKVAKVRVAVMPAKRGRRGRAITIRKAQYKKAFVTLSSGEIDLFAGL